MPIYYPLLRWKQGEQFALQNLSNATKDLIAPIIDFPDDCEHGDNRVINFCRNAVSFWGINRPFYVDLGTIDYGVVTATTMHPALSLLQTASRLHLVIIPVITTDTDPSLLAILNQAYNSGYIQFAALRIFRDEEATAHEDAAMALQEIGIQTQQCDLIIDLGDVSDGRIPSIIRVMQSLIAQFGTEFREIILLSGAFNPDEIQTDSHGTIRRNDFLLWRQALQIPGIPSLQFGDYATIQAELVEVPYQGAPKVKYTLDQDWYMIKGHRSRARDNQRQQLSQHMISQQFYRGAQYSFGDDRINQCAVGTWGPGSSTNWVTNDVSQHLTFVASQVNAILGGI